MTSTPTPPESVPQRPIVLGVVVDQPPEVLETAATYAKRFGAALICTYVDDSRFTVEVRDDGSVVSMPIDPDTTAEVAAEFPPELHSRLSSVFDRTGAPWSTRTLAGSPAQELSHLAEAVDAQMIIVGVRRAGFSGGLHEFFNGSVAVHLAHHQHRPLVVVPLRARSEGKK